MYIYIYTVCVYIYIHCMYMYIYIYCMYIYIYMCHTYIYIYIIYMYIHTLHGMALHCMAWHDINIVYITFRTYIPCLDLASHPIISFLLPQLWFPHAAVWVVNEALLFEHLWGRSSYWNEPWKSRVFWLCCPSISLYIGHNRCLLFVWHVPWWLLFSIPTLSSFKLHLTTYPCLAPMWRFPKIGVPPNHPL